MTTDPAKGLIGSLLHGLAILDMFARDRPEIGIGEMAQELGLHRSTTSRLAATLAMAGYLEPAGEPGRYRLSGRSSPRSASWPRPGATCAGPPCPTCRTSCQNLGETGHLAVLEGTEAVTIEVVDGWQTVRMHSWVGKRSPAHCSSMGKALLAGLPAAEIDARYPEARPRGPDDRDHHRTGTSSSVTSRRCAAAATRRTARSSSRTCAVSPGRSSTGPGRWWRASASPGPTHASMRRASPP